MKCIVVMGCDLTRWSDFDILAWATLGPRVLQSCVICILARHFPPSASSSSWRTHCQGKKNKKTTLLHKSTKQSIPSVRVRLDRHGCHVWRTISDFTSDALSPIVADIPFLFVTGIP